MKFLFDPWLDWFGIITIGIAVGVGIAIQGWAGVAVYLVILISGGAINVACRRLYEIE